MMRCTFKCGYCLITDNAMPGRLPAGWIAYGPSKRGTRYPSKRTRYFCDSTCSLAWSEQHIDELRAKE